MKLALRRVVSGMLAVLLAVTTLTAGAVPAFASNAENTTVKVGFFAYPGYHELNDDVRSGYGYDFLALLQRYTNLNYDYVGYDNTWEEMQQMLLDGTIDLVTSARKTEEREKLFDFSEPIGTNSARINVRAGDVRFARGDYAALDGITIGELAGNSRNEDMADFAEEKGLTYKSKEYATADELAQALQDGDVDAIVTSSLRKASGEMTVAEFATEYFYAIVKKGNTQLLDEVDYGISQMNANEGGWQEDLYYKNYENEAGVELVFTEREKAFIDAVRSRQKTITVTAQPDRDPYSFVENGKLTGIIPDYFAHLMNMAGLPYETVVAKDRDEFQEWTMTNHTDIVMDCRYPSAPSTELDFGIVTDPYMELTTSRVTRKGFSGTIHSIATVDSQGTNYIEEDIAGDAEYVLMDSRDAAMQAVKDGKADACYVYTYMAEKFINADPDNRLASTVLSYPIYHEYIYVSPDSDHELASILNKCLKADSSDALNGLISKYTSATPSNISLLQYLEMNPTLVVILAAVIAVILVLISFFIFRARAAKLRNAQLEERLRTAEVLNDNRTIIEVLSEDYLCIDYVKITESKVNDIGVKYWISERTRELLPGWEDELSFTKNLDMILEHVYALDRQQFYQDTRREHIVEKLGYMDAYYVNYRVLIDDAIEYHQVVFSAVREEGRLVGFVAGFRSIDETVRKEIEVQRQLEDALSKAESANRAKTEFLFNMSHDIRTPMNAILGFTGMAQKHLDDKEKVADCLEKTQQSGNLLLTLINEVLDLSRIEAGNTGISEEACDVLMSFSHIESTLCETAAMKDVDLSFEFGEVANRYVYADASRCDRVFTNLITNAIKFTGEGGHVRVRCEQVGPPQAGIATFRYTVADDGIGMSEEFQQHMFETFTREETSTVSGIQGTGLGLSVCKTFVELLGGTIECESTQGVGTTFAVTLPFKVIEDEAGAGLVAGQSTGAGAWALPGEAIDFRGKRVLLVDDNELNREIALDILEDEGLIVETAEDGDVAVEMLREKAAQGDFWYYDLVLMDIQMPHMNGYEATRLIRETPGTEGLHLPIIAVSANAFDEDRKASREAGMDGHIAKPINIETLKAALAGFLKPEAAR